LLSDPLLALSLGAAPPRSVREPRFAALARIAFDCVDAPLFRVTLPPGDRTGLTVASQVMADKIISVPRSAVSRIIGTCDDPYLEQIDEALRRWLDL
jgi:mRNA-degrading endonuclease toxin of MazEF toxin-antitoxin module